LGSEKGWVKKAEQKDISVRIYRKRSSLVREDPNNLLSLSFFLLQVGKSGIRIKAECIWTDT
jgi:hypothetical protein